MGSLTLTHLEGLSGMCWGTLDGAGRQTGDCLDFHKNEGSMDGSPIKIRE